MVCGDDGVGAGAEGGGGEGDGPGSGAGGGVGGEEVAVVRYFCVCGVEGDVVAGGGVGGVGGAGEGDGLGGGCGSVCAGTGEGDVSGGVCGGDGVYLDHGCGVPADVAVAVKEFHADFVGAVGR